MNFSESDILKLAELLKLPENDNNKCTTETEERPRNTPHKKNISKKELPRSMEEFEAQQEAEYNAFISNHKKQPRFDIKYRQAVTTEDIFLQMGGKTPSSASCEDMIIIIELPKERYKGIELNLTKTELYLEGFLFKLQMPLPHPIDPNNSNAKWNQDDETLTLTLRLSRELDYVNF